MFSDNALALSRTIAAAANDGQGRAIDLFGGGLGFAGGDCVLEVQTRSARFEASQSKWFYDFDNLGEFSSKLLIRDEF